MKKIKEIPIGGTGVIDDANKIFKAVYGFDYDGVEVSKVENAKRKSVNSHPPIPRFESDGGWDIMDSIFLGVFIAIILLVIFLAKMIITH